jgi:hypothetical protein
MAAPIYHKGLQVRQAAEVYEDCVTDFSTSLSRPSIWQNIARIVDHTALHNVSGKLILDSEFVDFENDPQRAALALIADQKITEKLFHLWHKGLSAKEWQCSTFALPVRPSDPEAAEKWDVTYAELLKDFTQRDTKGVPVVDFKECHTFTKSSQASTNSSP